MPSPLASADSARTLLGTVIEPGILPNREAWPDGLLDDLQKFRQGDLVEEFPALYLGDPDSPGHRQTAVYAGGDPGVIEFDPFPFGMILTQTCDLREENRTPRRPWVHIAPVYNGEAKYVANPQSGKKRSLIGSNIRGWLVEGRGPQYLLHLTDFNPEPGLWVADLRLIVATDKGWLAGRNPIRAFDAEADRREVGRRMASLHVRPAFDERFEAAVKRPLINALKELEEESELLGLIYKEVYEFGVRADDNIEMGVAEVWILSRGGLSDTVKVWFDDRSAEWQANAADIGLNLLPTQIGDLKVMSADEYLSLTRVPLSYVSPDPPWFGIGNG